MWYKNFVNSTLYPTVWKLREFSLNHFWQKFRENSSFTKEGGEREFLIFSHCGTENPSYLTLFFDENFVKITGILKKLLKIWFHDFFFFLWERISCFSTLCCMYVCHLLQQPGRYDEKLQWKPMVSGLFHILFVHQPLFSDEFNAGRSLRCLHEDWKGEIPKTFFAQKKGCTTCFQTTRDPGKAGTSQLPAFGGPFDRI